MEKTDAVEWQIEWFEADGVLNHGFRLTLCLQVRPEQNVDPTEIKIKTVSFLDPQEYLVVMEQLSLVVEIIDAKQVTVSSPLSSLSSACEKKTSPLIRNRLCQTISTPRL